MGGMVLGRLDCWSWWAVGYACSPKVLSVNSRIEITLSKGLCIQGMFFAELEVHHLQIEAEAGM